MKNSYAQDPICNLHIAKTKHTSMYIITTSKFKFKETHKLQVFEEDHNSFSKLCVEDSTLESHALVTQVCDL